MTRFTRAVFVFLCAKTLLLLTASDVLADSPPPPRIISVFPYEDDTALVIVQSDNAAHFVLMPLSVLIINIWMCFHLREFALKRAFLQDKSALLRKKQTEEVSKRYFKILRIDGWR